MGDKDDVSVRELLLELSGEPVASDSDSEPS